MLEGYRDLVKPLFKVLAQFAKKKKKEKQNKQKKSICDSRCSTVVRVSIPGHIC